MARIFERRDPASGYQMGDAMSEHPGLAGTGAGDHQQRAVFVGYRIELRRVEPFEERRIRHSTHPTDPGRHRRTVYRWDASTSLYPSPRTVTMRSGWRGSVSIVGTQTLHVDIESLGVADVVVAPDPIDEQVAGDHHAYVLHQHLEQLKLLERHLHIGPIDAHLVAFVIEQQIVDGELLGAVIGRSRVGARSTQNGSHAGHQLTYPVRLGHVVVGTHLESHHCVDFLVAGRHHDHRRGPGRPDLAADIDARQPGKHHIEQNQIW